jgi:hypothetical protein
MASNLLQGVLKHSAHERLDAFVHDKDDSDDELVNVVRSIPYSCVSQLLKVASFHNQERLHALAHPHVPHRLPVEHPVASLVDLYLRHLHPLNKLPIPSEDFLLRFLSESSLFLASVISLDARASVGNGTEVRR